MSDAEALGNELREARQGRDLTLEQAEQQTRIRAKYLEALEQGNYTALPSPVQSRGFLRNYARFLGLDGDLMVSRYDAVLQGGRRRGRRVEPPRQPTPPPSQPATTARRTQTVPTAPPAAAYSTPAPAAGEKAERRKGRSWFSTLILGIVGLAIFAAVLIVGASGLQSFLAQNPSGGVILSPMPRDATATLAVTATPETTPTTIRPTLLPSPNNPAATTSAGGVTVQLQVTERTWMRVIVDGQVSYMTSAPPNTMLQYTGNSIQIRVANAVGVHAVVNGQDMGVLGARGQIIDQTFTAGGTIQASPTAPPKPAANSPNAKGTTTVKFSATSPQATFSFNQTVNPPITATPLPTFPPTSTYTLTFTPSRTPTNTFTPSVTLTPSVTRTPSMTLTPSNTPLFLPRLTSTPEGGEIRPQ